MSLPSPHLFTANMVESGQVVLVKPLHGPAHFKLQPAPCRRPVKTSPSARESPIDPGLVQESVVVLKSVFEDEEEEEEFDILTPKPALSAQTLVLSPTPFSSLPGAVVVSPTLVQKLSCALPQRTLMRSLSSTCLLSPTSPERKSALLRRRLGWRGQKVQDEISIPISPESPLSPGRARQLHTPTTADSLRSLTFTMLNGSETFDSVAESKAPLSATLKALGAKRHSQTLPTETLPSKNTDENRTPTRKSFFLPTWGKLHNNDHKHVVEQPCDAAQGIQTLLLPRDFKSDSVHCKQDGTVHDAVVLPRVCQAGGEFPLSPNGHLFSGFDEVHIPTVAKIQTAALGADHVHVVHRPAIATLHAKDNASGKVSGLVTALRAGVVTTGSDFGQRGGGELISDNCVGSSSSRVHQPDNDQERRDGWGGILTRTSWFKSHTPGPLLSPCRDGHMEGRLKRLYLVNAATPKRHSSEVWEDVVSITAQPDAGVKLDPVAPRFRFAQPDKPRSRPMCFWKWRNRGAAAAPIDEKHEGRTRHLTANAQNVDKGPVSDVRIRVLLTLLVLALLASGIANIVLSTNRKPTHPLILPHNHAF